MSGWIDSPETQGCWRKGANCRTIASVTPCPKAARGILVPPHLRPHNAEFARHRSAGRRSPTTQPRQARGFLLSGGLWRSTTTSTARCAPNCSA